MLHATNLSDAFQLVDNYSPNHHSKNQKRQDNKQGSRKINTHDHEKDRIKGKEYNIKFPICSFGPHKAKRSRHYPVDFTACPEDEKNVVVQHIKDEKVATLPIKSTGGQ